MVFAAEPLAADGAAEWLRAGSSDPRTGELIETALAVLERGLAVAAATTGRAIGEPPGPEQILAARIGYGEGERVYEGRYAEALEIDPASNSMSARSRRLERIVPLSRMAGILGGRDRLPACEVMVPRVRADLDGGRFLPAALTIGEAVRATVAELEFALESPDHEQDMDRLAELLPDLLRMPSELLVEGEEGAGAALEEQFRPAVEAALELAERVIRRYRISSQ